MAHSSHLLIFLTFLLSFLAISTSAAPTTFAEVEESWQRGLSEKDIHTAIDQHPTPSYHSQIPYSHQHASDEDKETGFQGMLDERTMAVRRKLNSVIGEKRRGFVAVLFGGSREIEGEGNEGVEVLRPVRNRRWQF
ncbi:uncharacterized protein M437DRAFT_62698 [Aureobasidium melanogenum CBS 110374]|uniref:Uncharacterized protein n=1 Tax=Aureobasidium melanogenum (strain CBS 110374) TaxID=1043003 RepID=A0A074W996_AURM1|nr:uncharacterized protein M437DRAFT_62698 [Aureobasidium melanogenum CBS 110374]KEQ66502.1 hypothetical protein M437DRAFT_62698 [Aureobasidium melanogenum CBS 110374]